MSIPEARRLVENPSITALVREYMSIEPKIVYDYTYREFDSAVSIHTLYEQAFFDGWSSREVACCNLFFHLFDRLEFGPHFLTKKMVAKLMQPYESALKSCSEILQRQEETQGGEQFKQALRTVIDYSGRIIKINNTPRSVVLPHQTLPDDQHAMKVFVRDVASHSMSLYGLCFYGTLSKITNIAFQPRVKTTKESITKWCTSPKLVAPTPPHWMPFQ